MFRERHIQGAHQALDDIQGLCPDVSLPPRHPMCMSLKRLQGFACWQFKHCKTLNPESGSRPQSKKITQHLDHALSTGYRWLCKTGARQPSKQRTRLHSDRAVVDPDLLGKEVSADSCFVLTGKLVRHKLVHQRSLAHPAMQHTLQIGVPRLKVCPYACHANVAAQVDDHLGQ